MKVAIVGSRNFKRPDLIVKYVTLRLSLEDIIVSGGANGPDTIAVISGKNIGLKEPIIYHAKWSKYGKKAGLLRNTQIVECCDRVVAFWDGKSKGTKDTIAKARKLKKPVEIVFDNEIDNLLNNNFL